ncbi:MAG: hypothetical protein WCG27_08915 [Pseudomonadota bacterium]
MNILTSLKNFFGNHSGQTQSFTFFIPPPPVRKTGHREKEFDKIFYSLINKGYQLVSLHTQANHGQNGGMWVICLVRPLDKNVAPLLLTDLFADETPSSPSTANKDERIEGLYYLD